MLSRVAMVEDKVNDMLAAIPADKREIDSLGCIKCKSIASFALTITPANESIINNQSSVISNQSSIISNQSSVINNQQIVVYKR